VPISRLNGMSLTLPTPL